MQRSDGGTEIYEQYWAESNGHLLTTDGDQQNLIKGMQNSDKRNTKSARINQLSTKTKSY